MSDLVKPMAVDDLVRRLKNPYPTINATGYSVQAENANKNLMWTSADLIQSQADRIERLEVERGNLRRLLKAAVIGPWRNHHLEDVRAALQENQL